MIKKYFKNRLGIIAVALGVTIIVSVYMAINPKRTITSFSVITILTTSLLSALVGIIVTEILQTNRRNPISISLALLGYPEVGKTVYLTVLFEELQKTHSKDINFAPYGKETIEQVLSDISLLRNGKWLPRTKTNQVFFYRAYATVVMKSLLSNEKKYKIEFADYAGEHLDEFNPQKENWLHRTDYFQYVLQSDGLFLALDSSKFSKDIIAFRGDINGLIAAVQILAEKKGAINSTKVDMPICLLFLKYDLLIDDDVEEKLIINEAERLLSVCQNRYRFVKYYFVSSTGSLDHDIMRPDFIPKNVVEPLLWVLSKTKFR